MLILNAGINANPQTPAGSYPLGAPLLFQEQWGEWGSGAITDGAGGPCTNPPGIWHRIGGAATNPSIVHGTNQVTSSQDTWKVRSKLFAYNQAKPIAIGAVFAFQVPGPTNSALTTLSMAANSNAFIGGVNTEIDVAASGALTVKLLDLTGPVATYAVPSYTAGSNLDVLAMFDGVGTATVKLNGQVVIGPVAVQAPLAGDQAIQLSYQWSTSNTPPNMPVLTVGPINFYAWQS
jgi:hypothetical protein